MYNIEKYLINWILEDNSLLKELPLLDDDFLNDDCLKAFKILKEEISHDRKIDLVLLGKKLASIGIPVSNLVLTEYMPHGMHKSYFRELREHTINRKTREVMLWSEGKSYKDLQRELADIGKFDKKVFITGKQLLNDAIDALYAKRENPVTLPTGFKKLDDHLGLERGWLVTLAARSSIGKSAIAMNMAISMAQQGLNVLVYSLEMSPNEYMNRVLSQLSGVSNALWKYGKVDDSTIGVAADKFLKFSDNINIRYSSSFDSDEIVRDIYAYGKADVVIVDYLQLINDKEQRGETRTNMIGRITRKFKEVAVDMNCAVIQLSQVSREATKNDSKMPSLEQLRDSGSIEQDSEAVLILNREERDSTEGILRIAKNRHGSVGDIDLRYKPEICLYTEK